MRYITTTRLRQVPISNLPQPSCTQCKAKGNTSLTHFSKPPS